MAPILLLLDMNGTICYRTGERIPGAREDLYVRFKYYYKRRGIDDFVKSLASSGMFKVAVYSSMMAHNIQAGLNAIMTPATRSNIHAVLDRGMNKPDPNGQKEWDTIRDMNKVWSRLPDFGPNNTLLLDNETRKFGAYATNGIVVPEFGAAEVLSRKADTLDGLLGYLLELGRAGPRDVRDYLRGHPFRPSNSPAAVVRAPAAAIVPAPAAAQPSAADKLVSAMQGLLLGTRPTAASSSQGQPQAAANRKAVPLKQSTEPAQQQQVPVGKQPLQVPQGTTLHFVCIEGGIFKLTGMYSSADGTRYAVQVQGDAGKVELRIDAKIDYHRLMDEAAAAGTKLDVCQEVV